MTKHSASRRWPSTLGITALATVLGTVVALLAGAEVASAAALSNASFTGSSQAANATNTNWTVGFKTGNPSGSALASGDTVTVTFASGFAIPTTTPSVTLGAGFSNCTATASRTGTNPLAVTVTLAGGSCSLPSGTAAVLTIGSITNPAAGNYTNTSFLVRTTADNPASPTSNVVIFGTASKLAFTTQPPSTAASGAAFSTQPVVTVQDSGGRTVTSDPSSVTLAIASGPAGANLSCTNNPVAASSGVATFAGCKIDKAGAYTLTATDGSLTSAVSNSVTVSAGAATKLAFTQQPPATGIAGSPLTSFQVTVQDAVGNTVSATDTIALSIATGPAGATFAAGSTTSVAAVAGVATFSAVKLNAVGSYTFTATDTSRTLTTATSSPATILSAAAASKLVFVQGPTEVFAGSTFAPAITVQAQDQFGNPVAGVTVTLSSSAGPLDAGASATTDSSGLASFGSAQINTAATGLTLTATSTGLTAATSGTFDVAVRVTNGIPLTDAAADTGSGVQTVSYYYCPGLTGACTNGTLIGTASTPGNGYLLSWTGQPANGAYRLVAVASDNVSNVSSPSASIPIRISN